MSDFKDFLVEEAKRQQAGSSRSIARRAEWIEDVDDLLKQITEWLKQADEGGVLTLEPTNHQIREMRNGRYEINGLRVTLGSKEVKVEPIALFSIGSMVGDPHGTKCANGKVDLSSRWRRFMLYRQPETDADGKRKWIIVGDEDYIGRPLDRTSFEDAMKSLLE